MNGFAVSRDDSQAVTFNGNLSWADRGESVDHSEAVAFARCHCEDLQWRVGHESGVWITELPFAVDQHRLGILTCVDCQTAWVSLASIFVHPIRQQHDVSRQIKVIQVRVGVF